MCNNPAKFHLNRSSVFRGVAFTKLFERKVGRTNVDHSDGKNNLVIKRQTGIRSYTEHDLLHKQLDTVSKYANIFVVMVHLKNIYNVSIGKMLLLDPMKLVLLIWYFANLKLLLLK